HWSLWALTSHSLRSVGTAGHRKADFRCASTELVRCGQSRPLLMQLSLTQKTLACAARQSL
ncbi:MAG: hypothetical protein ACRBB0_25205, partial [Pelagimonas sp.]|uniref:hypothetical protein n=1 Tax=Pelagimonas sp. TaxID=2073170 RepID=UPI003D6AC183